MGQPYLRATTPRFDWPKGAVERRIDYALKRGVPVRGKVVEVCCTECAEKLKEAQDSTAARDDV